MNRNAKSNIKLKMDDTDILQPRNKFSYGIDFKYDKFDKDLRLTDFIKSVLIVTVEEPVPEHLERNWISIIEAINPNYYKVELINVRVISNDS